MNEAKGQVFAIERCSLHDGPGLRTTVFLKGCPLHCLWCHNPESQSFSPELYFLNEKCNKCGICISSCLKKCHSMVNNEHNIDRLHCSGCGECVSSCPYSALELKGEKKDVDVILAIVEEDSDFYMASGGGMTISGGEPLSQLGFTKRLLSLAKKKGIHNCIETSGFAPTEKLMEIKDDVDIFLFDIKETDPVRHMQYTGVDNSLILENLFELDRNGSKIILRCPMIPGMNDRESHLREIANLAERLENILEINIMPYHPMGKSKSIRVGKEYPLEGIGFTESSQLDKWMALISENTYIPVRKG